MDKRTDNKLSTRLLLILGLMGIGLIFASLLSVFFVNQGLLTLLVIQDVFAFIIPGLAAMAILYRQPLQVMGLSKAPSWQALLIIIAFYIVSLPGMNWLVDLNQAMTLPAWMSGMENWMRQTEDAAAQATQNILDINNIGQLLATVFVVGFMAGLSEEILFRGSIQQTMMDSRMGPHVVVWSVAIVFSAFHMQFYGFFPRMVLGLWLGYLLFWSRCLWVPILAHTLNNSTVVFMSYLANMKLIPEGFGDSIGIPAQGDMPWLAITSIIASIALAVYAQRHFKNANQSTALS